MYVDWVTHEKRASSQKVTSNADGRLHSSGAPGVVVDGGYKHRTPPERMAWVSSWAIDIALLLSEQRIACFLS